MSLACPQCGALGRAEVSGWRVRSEALSAMQMEDRQRLEKAMAGVCLEDGGGSDGAPADFSGLQPASLRELLEYIGE
jgi:hypothetical protein